MKKPKETFIFNIFTVLGLKPIPERATLDSHVSDQGRIHDST